MDNFVVTFARGFGTGGKAIASQLAKELGIHCYENRILTLASQLSGLDENVFQEVNEKLREEGGFTSFLRGLPRAKGYISLFRCVQESADLLLLHLQLVAVIHGLIHASSTLRKDGTDRFSRFKR